MQLLVLHTRYVHLSAGRGRLCCDRRNYSVVGEFDPYDVPIGSER